MVAVKEKFNLFSLILTLVIAFAAALGGAYFGAYLGNKYQQKMIDRSTKTKIKIMYLETQYNVSTSNELYTTFSKTQTLEHRVKELEDFAARTVLHDGNISNILRPYQVSLIQSYVEAINVVNRLKDRYSKYLDVVKYNITPDGIDMRNSIKENTAAFMATLYMVQKEFKNYFEDFRNSYDHEKAKNIEEEIKKIKQKILNGEFKLTK